MGGGSHTRKYLHTYRNFISSNTTVKAPRDPQNRRKFGTGAVQLVLVTDKPCLLAHHAPIFRFLRNKEPLLMAIILFGEKGGG